MPRAPPGPVGRVTGHARGRTGPGHRPEHPAPAVHGSTVTPVATWTRDVAGRERAPLPVGGAAPRGEGGRRTGPGPDAVPSTAAESDHAADVSGNVPARARRAEGPGTFCGENVPHHPDLGGGRAGERRGGGLCVQGTLQTRMPRWATPETHPNAREGLTGAAATCDASRPRPRASRDGVAVPGRPGSWPSLRFFRSRQAGPRVHVEMRRAVRASPQPASPRDLPSPTDARWHRPHAHGHGWLALGGRSPWEAAGPRTGRHGELAGPAGPMNAHGGATRGPSGRRVSGRWLRVAVRCRPDSLTEGGLRPRGASSRCRGPRTSQRRTRPGGGAVRRPGGVPEAGLHLGRP